MVQNIYPPDDPGLSLGDVEHLLAGNESLLSRLRLHAAADPARFEARYLGPIRRLAEHISILPGTASGLFAGEGGLFRASLELAFLSFQASDGRIFTGAANVETRHKLEPRWRYICFAAGLLYPIGSPLARMAVSARGGATWQKHRFGLTEWAQSIGADRVYVSWPTEDAATAQNAMGPSPYTASIISKIFGPEILTWLDEGSPDLTRTVFELVGGNETQSRIAKDVIDTMWDKVKQREEARRPQTYGRLTVGTHLPPYLIGAMRSLVESGIWKPNQPPFMVDATGIYLVWPAAGEDLVRQGAKEGREGWPSSASTLAEILKQAGIFDTTRGNDLGMTEVIDGEGVILAAYKLRNPNAVIEDYEPSAWMKSAPKTLAGVLQNDPLARSKPVEVPAPPQSQMPPAPAATLIDDSSLAEEPGEGLDEDEVDGVPPQQQVAHEPTAESTEVGAPPVETPRSARAQRQPAQDATPAEVPGGRIKEAGEVRFSDLVPEEIRKEIRSPLSVELLGKVIKAWRERGEQSATMRMTDMGAAVSVEFLSTMMRSMPDWVNEIAAAGLVYAPQSTPGLKVQRIAIPEGGKTREAIIISRYGCKKLGL